jgi:diguanylate cyclase (GGDEF)-like protein
MAPSWLRSTWIVVALLALTPMGMALAARPAMPLTFEALQSLGSDGQSILSIAQDSKGFIWIGTIESGLFRYDGHALVKYVNDPDNPASLPGGRVAALHADAAGDLWIGTDEGLARFDPATNGFTRYALPGGEDSMRIVRRIVSDGKQGMWLATWGGLQHFDVPSGRFQAYRADPSQPGALRYNDVNAVALDRNGGVYAATWPAGIDYLAPGATSFQRLRLDSEDRPEPRLNDVRALHFDTKGYLWIGTDAGVVRWQAGQPWSTRVRLDGPRRRINSIDADAGGGIWISTRTEGLQRWNEQAQRLEAYLHRPEDTRSLPSNSISAVMADRSGTLWIATFTDGVRRANVNNAPFSRIVPRDIAQDGFPTGNFVRSLETAPEGRLWMGMEEGLALFDPATRRIVRKYTAGARPGDLSHSSVYSLYQQPGGPLWVGTTKGLNRLDPLDGRFSVRHFGTPANDFINTIAPGRGGILWLGTAGSLIRYDPASGTSKSYLHETGNPASRNVNDASAVLEDSQGRLWVGDVFRGGGLALLDQRSGRFRHFRHSDTAPRSLNSDKVTCLYEDKAGTVWIGTVRGLHRLVFAADGTPEFQRYLGPNQPGPVPIEAIRGDDAGKLWISTAKGISRLDPATDTFAHYSADDGLSHGFFLQSSAQTGNGDLYFGSTTGITAVYPAQAMRAPSPPQVSITDIRLFGRSLGQMPRPPLVQLAGAITAPTSLTLPSSATALSIEFAALHYAAPARNSYTFMLAGFDNQWVKADGAHPNATYTNLSPGSYTFYLRATSSDGIDSPTIVLPIAILPPYWQTWWFRGGAALLAVLAVAWAYKVRVRRLTRRTGQLEALVASRTRELEQSNIKLMALSVSDGLTGLVNRRGFDELLEREWAHARRDKKPLALAMLDVDSFKLYNDFYGHQAGDECLKQVAAAMTLSLQRSTDLAARYGGEEFVFVLPGATAEDAMLIAEKVRCAVAALAIVHEKSTHGIVTVSIGVASAMPADPQSASAMLRAADQALYRAKAAGRNRSMPATAGGADQD